MPVTFFSLHRHKQAALPREAIRHAAALAESGDVILVAGKGHETYQIFPDRTIHFDDVEEVRDAFGADCIGKDSI